MTRQSTLIAALLLALCLAIRAQAAAPVSFYVSPAGRDSWTGTLPAPNARRTDGPLATLSAARDRVRALPARPGNGGITVWIEAGTYRLGAPLTLGPDDSGAPGCPVTYRARPHARVTVTGGRSVSGWTPVADPKILARLSPGAAGHVLVADLAAQGISDYGDLARRGFSAPTTPAGLELFFRHRPMPLSRWPQTGWAHLAAARTSAGGSDLTYTGNEPSRWADASAGSSGDIWLYGYWAFDWADDTIPLSSIDAASHTLHTPPPALPLGITAGARFRAINILEELNQPGEWYLDRAHGRLYFWPPAPITPGSAVVSIGTSLVRMSGVSDVAFRGITFEACRGTAITLNDCSRCRIAGCVLEDIGNDAVEITGGVGDGVAGCDIADTGDCGIVLDGGDRKTLAPGGNFVDDCDIARFGRWDRTYRPAVLVSGVGNRVTRCAIHDAPHAAVILSGNDNVIAGNDIARVCTDTSDAGAFYIGRDWTMRGNVVRGNYFHQIGALGASKLRGFTTVNAIYLDDCASGTTVTGNICRDTPNGLLLGGGRDNVVERNLFLHCATALQIDARGLGWAKPSLSPGGDWHMQEKLAAVSYDHPPYSARYPFLATILTDNPGAPKGNIVSGNVIADCGDNGKWLNMDPAAQPFIIVKETITGVAATITAGRVRFQPAKPAGEAGFPQFAMEKIGLYPDADRAALPALSTTAA